MKKRIHFYKKVASGMQEKIPISNNLKEPQGNSTLVSETIRVTSLRGKRTMMERNLILIHGITRMTY